MRVALLLVVLVAAGLVLWLFSAGDPAGAAPQALGPSDPAPPAAAPATRQRVESTGRSEISPEESFATGLRSKYGELDDEALRATFWRLTTAVNTRLQVLGQPRIARGEGAPATGQPHPPEELWFTGPGPDGRMHEIRLLDGEQPTLLLNRREALWLAGELERRGVPLRD